MINSRANFLSKEDLRDFPLLDGDGWLMEFFKQICADMDMKKRRLHCRISLTCGIRPNLIRQSMAH